MPESINTHTITLPATVTIGSADLVPLEIDGQRVVTLAMIDEVHERPSGTARRNFNNHRERMIEGKHCFVRNSYEAAELGIVAPNGVTLLTERGYLMLVKSFTDDLAWTVQDMLVENYFAKPVVQLDPRVALSNPASLRTLLLENVEKVIALQGEVEEMRPQVLALERIAISDGSMCITDTAKTLQVQPKSLFSFMREHHWIYTRQGDNTYIAYQDKLQSGLLEHKTTVVTRSDGSEKTTTQVRVTPKGLTRLAKVFPPVATAA